MINESTQKWVPEEHYQETENHKIHGMCQIKIQTAQTRTHI